ncbi:hypothetical protein BD413DRAFT_269584 [Trametes elegans]|nr:hypothetical protein BD413DRAFT_269584 [Trametes elegans]
MGWHASGFRDNEELIPNSWGSLMTMGAVPCLELGVKTGHRCARSEIEGDDVSPHRHEHTVFSLLRAYGAEVYECKSGHDLSALSPGVATEPFAHVIASSLALCTCGRRMDSACNDFEHSVPDAGRSTSPWRWFKLAREDTTRATRRRLQRWPPPHMQLIV